MKKIIYRIFKNSVWSRYNCIKQKQIKRLNAVILAREEMNRWWDIPYTWQRSSISKILCFPKNSYIDKDFYYYIGNNKNPYNLITKHLPLDWYK